MAKRFYDSQMFRRPQMRNLPARYKLLFFYVTCECDHAGVWDVELDVASLRLGFDYDALEAKDELRGVIHIFDGGAKWFVPLFLEIQYGKYLNPRIRAVDSAINLLHQYELTNLPEVSGMLRDKPAAPKKEKPEPEPKRGKVDGAALEQAIAESEAKADDSVKEASGWKATPYKAIVDSFNSLLARHLGMVVGNTRDRQKKMDVVFDYVGYELKFIEAYFKRVAKSKWLRGKVAGRGNWRADFDWLMDEQRYVRTMEGHYDDERTR